MLAAILPETKDTAEAVSGVTSGNGIVKSHSVVSEAGFVPQGMKISQHLAAPTEILNESM